MPVAMTLFRVYGDEEGETHVVPIQMPLLAGGGSVRRLGLQDIPATTVTITELLEPKPDAGLHVPPRRQLVVVLRGELEITPTTGECQRLRPGDCLLADDLDSNGHITREVGSEPLSALTVGISVNWEPPSI